MWWAATTGHFPRSTYFSKKIPQSPSFQRKGSLSRSLSIGSLDLIDTHNARSKGDTASMDLSDEKHRTHRVWRPSPVLFRSTSYNNPFKLGDQILMDAGQQAKAKRLTCSRLVGPWQNLQSLGLYSSNFQNCPNRPTTSSQTIQLPRVHNHVISFIPVFLNEGKTIPIICRGRGFPSNPNRESINTVKPPFFNANKVGSTRLTASTTAMVGSFQPSSDQQE